MRRYSFWRAALFDYVERVAHLPFRWGVHDCALFAAGAVHAMTGEDIAAGYRGRYQTLRGGLRLLKRKGFDDHAAMAGSRLDEIHPSKALVGDVAAVVENGHVALGIVQGERVYVLRPEAGGIGTVALTEAKRAFRVPFPD